MPRKEHKGYKVLTNAQRDKILYDKLANDKPNIVIAKEMDISPASVSLLFRTLEMVKSNDWEEIKRRTLASGLGVPLVEWAADRANIIIPPEYYEAVKEAKEKKQEENRGKVKEYKLDNSTIYMMKLLEALNEIKESLNTLVEELK